MKEKPYHINHFIKYFEVSNRKYKKCKTKRNKWTKTSFINKKLKINCTQTCVNFDIKEDENVLLKSSIELKHLKQNFFYIIKWVFSIEKYFLNVGVYNVGVNIFINTLKLVEECQCFNWGNWTMKKVVNSCFNSTTIVYGIYTIIYAPET